MRVAAIMVSADVIDPAGLQALVMDPGAGAVVLFTGVVRDNDGGRAVTALQYEAHPDAAAMLASLVENWGAKHSDVCAVAAAHRVGLLEVGDVAFCAAVSSAHRAAAFAACADLVDLVKAELPVWKHQQFADGALEWVGLA